MQVKYFDFHVFYDRNNNYSKFIARAVPDDFFLDEDDFLDEIVKLRIMDNDEAVQVDYIEEITAEEYYELVDKKLILLRR